MAAPTYATDLLPFDLAEAITNWAESTDSNWDDGGGPAEDGDSYLQGSKCVSAITSLLKTGYATLIANYGGGISVPQYGAVLVWQYYTAPNAIETEANGGQMVVAGSSLADFKYWITGGNDYPPNPYGGWKNVAVDPSIGGTSVGSPTGVIQYVGAAVRGLRSIGKGNPFCVDAIRFGRCEARFTNGDSSNGYCTFAGFAAVNDVSTARWGLIQIVGGGYLWKGLMTIGYSTAAEFVDSDKNITIDECKRVDPNFTRIDVRQAATKLYWTRISFTALGTNANGYFEMFDNADVQLTSCQFTGMKTFIFLSAAQVLDTTFLKCGQITAPGCHMTGSRVLLSTVAADASAVVWAVALDPDSYLDDMTFSRGAALHHAISFGTNIPDEITIRGWTTSGFNAANEQNDSTFYVARTTGAVTINVVGGIGNFSYKSAGANVTIVINPAQLKVVAKSLSTGGLIEGAQVEVRVSDGSNFPYQDLVTITRIDSTAYVAHTGHGLASGEKVFITGANQQEYNGIKEITVTGVDEYTYTVVGTPVTPATGTITSTLVLISGLTNSSGWIADSRTYQFDQPVEGKIRKGTASPFYKGQPIEGTVDSGAGVTITLLLASDE